MIVAARPDHRVRRALWPGGAVAALVAAVLFAIFWTLIYGRGGEVKIPFGIGMTWLGIDGLVTSLLCNAFRVAAGRSRGARPFASWDQLGEASNVYRSLRSHGFEDLADDYWVAASDASTIGDYKGWGELERGAREAIGAARDTNPRIEDIRALTRRLQGIAGELKAQGEGDPKRLD